MVSPNLHHQKYFIMYLKKTIWLRLVIFLKETYYIPFFKNMPLFSLLFTGTSDPAMKEFLLHLDETMALGKKFILKDLDESHLFILAEVVQILQERVGELMDQNSFPITQK